MKGTTSTALPLLLGHGEAAPRGILPELPQLGLGVLAFVVGGDAGVERGPAGRRGP